MYRPDITARTPDGELVAVVEIKAGEIGPEDATEIRERIRTSMPEANKAYILVLTQDNGYLWRPLSSGTPPGSLPTEFPMTDVVRHFLPEIGPSNRLRESELSLIMLQWLRNLGSGEGGTGTEAGTSLAESGFTEAIRKSEVRWWDQG